MRSVRVGLTALIGLLLALPAAGLGDDIIVVKADRLIDGSGAAPLEDAVLVVEGSRITSVGPASELTLPSGAQVIELRGHTILPGLMDCHVHITGQPGDGGDTQKLRETVAHQAIHGVVNARTTLEAGFTTIRNVGAGSYADAALRDSITKGLVVGPRILAATMGLGSTGGHADINGWSPEVDLPGYAQIVDGIDSLRRAVRTQVKFGADFIKVTATGGVLSAGTALTEQAYSLEELRAVVETARLLGRKVAAHAHTPAGMNDAVRAGVASIEHGSLIDDEGIRLMKENGTYLVPTLYTLEFIIHEGSEFGVPEYSIEKARSMAKRQRERLREAYRAGVKFAYGTDAAVFPHGRNAKDFKILVEDLGVPPLDAVRMATFSAAELLGIADEVGTLKPGLLADAIAVEGNPLDDITLLEDVRFVMKAGVVYKGPDAQR